MIAEETSERYDYVPASMRVIQDVCLKYACDCTIRTATKPPQPIEKSTAGASLLAQVIVAKWADHQPLHRQEKMFERHGIEISRKTMGGWMAQCADLLDPLYQWMKKELLGSKVIGTDDTSVKVLDRKLPFARIGRIWPYVGDAHHPVIVYDYTPTRSRAGPAKFLERYKGYLQADAYSVYDAFFKSERGMTEVGSWMHARRYFLIGNTSNRETLRQNAEGHKRLELAQQAAEGQIYPKRADVKRRRRKRPPTFAQSFNFTPPGRVRSICYDGDGIGMAANSLVTPIEQLESQLEHPTPEIVWARAQEVFGDEDKARSWMNSPRDILGGRSPQELASGSPDEQREVLRILLRIEFGVFS